MGPGCALLLRQLSPVQVIINVIKISFVQLPLPSPAPYFVQSLPSESFAVVEGLRLRMEGWSSKYPSPLGMKESSEIKTQPCSGSSDLLPVLLTDALRVAAHSELCTDSSTALDSSIPGNNLAADLTGPCCRGVIGCLRGLELCNGGGRRGINSNFSCAGQKCDANVSFGLDVHLKNWVSRCLLGLWDFLGAVPWCLNKAPHSPER